jgi:multicomponent Na+:H+ antiporter subunit D
MTAEFSPGLILILGSVLVPLLRARARSAYLLLLPLAGLAYLVWLPYGEYGRVAFLEYELTLVRADRLSFLFGYIFMIAAWLSAIYALHVKEAPQHVAALVYAGSATSAVFAGDLLTLFVFWELTAVSSAVLIWARGTERAYRAGMRYLIIQLVSGVLLMLGALVQVSQTGSLAFGHIGLEGPGGLLIFLAFGVKCAFPLLHNWLQDAYPEATVTGTVFLSAFTTKLAVYALARGYPGTEILIWIGAAMTAFPIFYAVIENDLRRVLSYSLNNQLGFMVVGIGVGTELALNGTAAHAFSHILYKALLFMSMGAVLHRVGTVNGTDLGGLYKSMPWTASFCIVGAASISAFPLFSGFVSKSLILTATAEQGYFVTWIVLLFASAGVFHHSGIKIPYFAFFAHDSGKRCAEAPLNMLTAMALTAALCIGIGIYPQPLYALLPFPVHYEPYTSTHVLSQLQLLVFSALAFSVLMWTGIYPPEMRAVNLDSDWIYRGAGRRLSLAALEAAARGRSAVADRLAALWTVGSRVLYRHHGPEGILARTWPTGSMALWMLVLLLAYLLFYYL